MTDYSSVVPVRSDHAIEDQWRYY